MLDRSLKPYLNQNENSPIYMGKLSQYISTLDTRRIEAGSRAQFTPGRESQGVVLLRHALALADAKMIRQTWSTDLDRYMNGLLPIFLDIERLFDSAMTGQIQESRFIRAAGSTRTTELIIPVQMADAVKQLPLGKGWAAWQNVRAVRLVDVYSDELTFNTVMDQIIFKHDVPEFAVFTIDVVALTLQYIKYLDLYDGSPPDSVQEYLHKYVLNQGLLEDLENLWLRNRYIHLIKNPTLGAFDKQDITRSIYHNIWGYIGIQYTAAMEETYRLILRCKDGTTTPDRVLASLPLSDMTVPYYVRELRDATSVLNIRQNYWVEYLRDLAWIKMAYYTYLLNPGYVGYDVFMRQLKRDLGLLMNTRFWQSIHKPAIRDRIKRELTTMLEWTAQESLLTLLDDE